MKTPLLIPMILAASVSLIACDGPVEPIEVPVSAIPNADGATQDVPSSNSGSGAETGVAPYGQDPAHPDPEKDEEAATEATGSTVEGSNQSPAAGSPTPDDQAQPGDAEEEEQSAEESEEPPAPNAPKYQGSPATLWSGQGTAGMPKFGVNCRLATDKVFESATNGQIDDTLHFTTYSSNAATLDIFVEGYGGEALNLTVDINRGLKGRSYRQATGTANYNGIADVPVMDGTLCFQEKAAPGADVLAEFSFILNDGGVYTSVAGLAVIPGDAISMPNSGLAIDAASELDIDLR